MKNTLIGFIKKQAFISDTKRAHSDRFLKKPVDSILEYLRFAKAKLYIPKGATLLDVGAGDGNFFRYLNGHIQSAVGIDSNLTQSVEFGDCRLIPGYFPHDFVESGTFDVITMLAVIEHIPEDVLPEVADACWKYLKPSGRVVITVPHPRVDRLLEMMKRLRIIEGISIHEHYGFNPECLTDIFKYWKLVKKERWEFGCNNLFIFEKP